MSPPYAVDPDWRDDPTKYYLLDPSLIGSSSPSTASGGFSGSGSSRLPPGNASEVHTGVGGGGSGGMGSNGVGVASRAQAARKSRKAGATMSTSTVEGDNGE